MRLLTLYRAILLTLRFSLISPLFSVLASAFTIHELEISVHVIPRSICSSIRREKARHPLGETRQASIEASMLCPA